MVSLKVTAPTRIDFLGGTLDIWPLHQVLKHKATINIGINLRAEVLLKTLPKDQFYIRSEDQAVSFKGTRQELCRMDEGLRLVELVLAALWDEELPGLELSLLSRSPKGAGIGGSSSLAIALAASLFKARTLLRRESMPSKAEILNVVRDVEALLIKAPTGCQDYWAALNGGLSCLSYPAGNVASQIFPVEVFPELDARTLVVYSGKSRFSGMNNWQVFKGVFDKDERVIASLEKMGALAEQGFSQVKRANLDEFFKLCQAEWELRRQLCPEIESPETKAIDHAAKQSGALFSRVCGAGGGGVMLIALDAKNPRRQAIESAVREKGAVLLNAPYTNQGLAFEELS